LTSVDISDMRVECVNQVSTNKVCVLSASQVFVSMLIVTEAVS